MANASSTDDRRAQTEDSVEYKLKQFFASIVGKVLLFVVFLLLFGRILDWVAINTGLLTHSTAISLIVGLAYSLAGVIVLVGLIAGLTMAIRD